MNARALCLILALGAQGERPAATAFDLVSAVEQAVDLPTPKQRRAAARTLARRRDISLEKLLRVLRTFGRFEPVDTGPRVERVALAVGREVEDTELVVYVPQTYDPDRPAPLLVAFHGTGGSARGQNVVWRETAEELGMLVLAPSETGANEGYEFSQRERAAALAAMRWMRRRHNVDENRIFLTGISRGGHLAWDLALRHPDRFAAIAPMIGGPRVQLRRAQNNFRYLENLVQLPIRDLQGAQDDPALVANVRLAFDELARMGAVDAELIEFPELGHGFDFDAVDWTAFLSSARRRPLPERVVRLVANADHGRAFWVDVTHIDKRVAEVFTPQVKASEWNELDEAARRKTLADLARERTARIELRQIGRGRFHGSGENVRGFRLLLSEGQFDPDEKVRIDFASRIIEKRVRADAEVVLREFVERFDRSFLPVAEIEVRVR